MSTYKIVRTESKEEILNFWENSPDATVFSHPSVLPMLVNKVDWWVAYKGIESVCMWPVCTPDFRNGGISKFVYYVGPMWNKSRNEMTYHRWFEMGRAVYQGFLKEVIEKQKIQEASLPLTLNDVREFQWYNFDFKEKMQIDINIKYTGIINDLHLKSSDDILMQMNQSRRREIIKVNKNKAIYYTENCSESELLGLYKNHFENIGYNFNIENESKKINQLFEIVRNGFGYLCGYREEDSNNLIAVILVLNCSKTANGIINLLHENYRNSGIGTALIYQSILKAKSIGLKCFDFNGANSPIRGYTKHSLGAEAKLYFELKFNHIQNVG